MCLHIYILTYVHTYRIVGWLFSLGANFPEFPKWIHNSGKFILGCCIKFDFGSLVELDATVIFLNINLLHPIQGSIKQQNTFTTIAAANFEVIASYRGCYEWF